MRRTDRFADIAARAQGAGYGGTEAQEDVLYLLREIQRRHRKEIALRKMAVEISDRAYRLADRLGG